MLHNRQECNWNKSLVCCFTMKIYLNTKWGPLGNYFLSLLWKNLIACTEPDLNSTPLGWTGASQSPSMQPQCPISLMFPAAMFQNLVESLPRRMEAIIVAYWWLMFDFLHIWACQKADENINFSKIFFIRSLRNLHIITQTVKKEKRHMGSKPK